MVNSTHESYEATGIILTVHKVTTTLICKCLGLVQSPLTRFLFLSVLFIILYTLYSDTVLVTVWIPSNLPMDASGWRVCATVKAHGMLDAST